MAIEGGYYYCNNSEAIVAERLERKWRRYVRWKTHNGQIDIEDAPGALTEGEFKHRHRWQP